VNRDAYVVHQHLRGIRKMPDKSTAIKGRDGLEYCFHGERWTGIRKMPD
jgi:hypothetical protein